MVRSQKIVDTADENHQHLRHPLPAGQMLQKLTGAIHDLLLIAAGHDLLFSQKQIGNPVFPVLHGRRQSSVTSTGRRADEQLIALRNQMTDLHHSPAAMRRRRIIQGFFKYISPLTTATHSRTPPIPSPLTFYRTGPYHFPAVPPQRSCPGSLPPEPPYPAE